MWKLWETAGGTSPVNFVDMWIAALRFGGHVENRFGAPRLDSAAFFGGGEKRKMSKTVLFLEKASIAFSD